MGFVSVALFFLYSYGLGFSVSRFVKNSESFFERNIMRLGFGLAGFVVLGILLNALRIPLDWRIFLAAGMLPLLFFAVKDFVIGKKKAVFGLRIRKSDLGLAVALAVFIFALFMYAGGSFRYPYLEDEDPWGHAVGVKYVSVEKRAFDTQDYNFAYIDPYPPGYDIVMGVLHQTEPSLQFTLKFFNGLIIALGILWFFFMAKLFVGSGKAALAAFILAMIPSYFTHFIWAHTLVIALFFPALYAFWMIREDKKWLIPAAVSVAAILLSQPDQPIKLAVMIFVFLAVSAWHGKKFPVYEAVAGVLGVLLSLSWWAAKGAGMFKYAMGIGVGGSAFNPAGGSASRAYSFSDFVFPNQSLINVPPGFGPVISLLLLFGLVAAALNYKKIMKGEKPWLAVVLLWFVFAFLGTNSATFSLPIGLNPFRFWLLLAIPVAILAAEGAWFVASFASAAFSGASSASSAAKPFVVTAVKLGVLLVFAVAVFLTSGTYKLGINNSAGWYGGPLQVEGELPGYLWLKNLPPDTKVLSPADDSFIIGLDAFSCAWCPETIEFKKGFFSRSPNEISSFMRKNSYQYIILGSVEIGDNPDGSQFRFLNETIVRKEIELNNSSLFTPVNVYENGAVAVFRVR
ncbi:hypothetical protein HYV82_05750 [Candidatus Woesearchaeota archaeon]|nr:hypothetical protein [Candidatus Woesearchaeota archaeon]